MEVPCGTRAVQCWTCWEDYCFLYLRRGKCFPYLFGDWYYIFSLQIRLSQGGLNHRFIKFSPIFIQFCGDFLVATSYNEKTKKRSANSCHPLLSCYRRVEKQQETAVTFADDWLFDRCYMFCIGKGRRNWLTIGRSSCWSILGFLFW